MSERAREITQAHRIAAAEFYNTWGGTRGWAYLAEPILAGECDDNMLAQALANAEERGRKTRDAEICAWLNAMAVNCRIDMAIERYGDEATQHASEMLQAAADAIERGDV